MLKGVHHQIIEIRQTDHPYFERALLFVRAGCAEMSEADCQRHGRELVARAHAHAGLRLARGRRVLAACLWGIGGAVLGVLLSKMG